jgi:hypothetical protein
MEKGWKFVGEFKRGRKAYLAIECIVALPDLEEAEAIASKELVGADQITAKELSRAEMRALKLKEGDVLIPRLDRRAAFFFDAELASPLTVGRADLAPSGERN